MRATAGILHWLNPSRIDDCFQLDSFLGIFNQHFFYEFFSIFWYFFPGSSWKNGLLSPNFMKYLLLIFSAEGRWATEEKVEKNTKWPIIAFMVIEFAYDFRCNIGDLWYRGCYCSYTFIGRWVQCLHLNSTAKINQFSYSFFFIVNDIFKFHIPCLIESYLCIILLRCRWLMANRIW